MSWHILCLRPNSRGDIIMIDKSKYVKTAEGSYKSTAFENPESIYMDEYWSAHRNHSTIEEQKTNVVEKNQMVIREVGEGPVLEIGCAPGTLLGRLKTMGYDCMGIEVDPRYGYELRKNAKCAIHFGLFPEVTKDFIGGFFGTVIALDVIEHVEDGQGFLRECNRLLKPKGTLIIQAPIILEDGAMDDNMWHYVEHVIIYSIQHLEVLLQEQGFRVDSVKRWKVGHEQIVATKL